MFVVTYRKIFYAISVVLIAFSVFSVSYWGINLGIDFKGGSIMEVAYANNRPSQAVIQEAVNSLQVGESLIRSTSDDGYIIRTKTLTEQQRRQLIAALSISGSATPEIKRFDTVGPILGKELQGKAIWSIILVMLAIVIFITFVFRHVSKPVASWKYGLVAVVALLHDVIIPIGVFTYLGRNGGYELDALFITALLVILGFSVHDTIVVFDRTRENLKLSSSAKKPFEEIVGGSISQTFTRSINTTLTVVLALIALYVWGPEATRNFSLALIVGVAIGTYSSIFIGSPLLVTLQKFQKKS